jgi:hypothetical protein
VITLYLRLSPYLHKNFHVNVQSMLDTTSVQVVKLISVNMDICKHNMYFIMSCLFQNFSFLRVVDLRR